MIRTYKLVNHALLALFLAAAPFAAVNAAEHGKPSIQVTGTGTVSVAPDMAEINFGVVSEAETAANALKTNSASMRNILATLSDKGIAERDIQTSRFNIQPNYIHSPRKKDGTQAPPRITGYTVSNNVTVRVRELGETGSILDTVVSLGVNTGGNISFTNADTAKILEEAREKAVADAVEKATTLARAAGVTLTNITSIREQSHNAVPHMRARAEMMVASDGGVPIASGENTYRVNVEMSWHISQ